LIPFAFAVQSINLDDTWRSRYLSGWSYNFSG